MGKKQIGTNMANIDETLLKLKASDFRASFHLKEKEKRYVREKGLDTVRRHAEDIIRTRLAPAYPENDGKQTPMKNHPVFIAQHACACCCRGCLNKWYKVKKGVPLTDIQQNKIVSLIMAWIEKELEDE